MDVAEQRRNAKKFIEEWKDRGREKQDSQSFWLSLLRNVLGIEKPEEVIRFEEKVKLTHDSFIDGYIDQTHTMIEQKGSNKDLDKAIRQSDGSLLTPFQQAQRYSMALPYSKRPRWIVTCNFKEFRIYDMEQPNSEPTKIALKDLATDFYQLDFLVDKENEHLEKEQQISIVAGDLVSKIYKELANIFDNYKQLDEDKVKHSINSLCVRLVFCLYAEDAGLFDSKEAFYNYLKNVEPNQIGLKLKELFQVLNTKIEDRDKKDAFWTAEHPLLAQFPYVNGGLFADESIFIPPFTEELKRIVLDDASKGFDWSNISPTIFGAVFESTLNPETRRQGGMHYTSIENIHKVIDPLFLDDLKQELEDIKKYKNRKTIQEKAVQFQEKLSNLTFFDPACGSGNFLTETFLSLRRLENEAIRLETGGASLLDTGQAGDWIKVSIKQFYGIEINDFAVSVAKTAMWIAEDQMQKETQDLLYAPNWDFLPLKTYVNIHEGNALTMDWNTVLPNYACHYIISNPPFVGAKKMTKTQREELANLVPKQRNVRSIDFVCGWYFKAGEYIKNTKIECCYVSTNSITQGIQAPILWKEMINHYKLHINFAYRSFRWDSEAKLKAHVFVVIVCFSAVSKKTKYIFNESDQRKTAQNISGYLLDAPNIYATGNSKPICNVSRLTEGNLPADGGNLILNEQEAKTLLEKNPKLKEVIKRYIGARDFLHNNTARYCLWLKDKNPSIYANNTFILKRLQAVKDFRSQSSAKPTREKANIPYQFFSTPQGKGKYIIIPRVSSQRRAYIPMGIADNAIVGDSLSITKMDSIYSFGVLESVIHMAWMKTVAGRLKKDYRYSGKVVYNTFPWANPTDEQRKKIEKTAQGILDARAKYPDSSLADLYDPLLMPVALRKAHKANDKAVIEAYNLPIDATESEIVAHLFKMYEQLTKDEK